MNEPKQAPRSAAEEPERTTALLTPAGRAPARRKPRNAPLVEQPGGILTRNPPRPEDIAERRQPQAGGRGVRSLTVTPDSYNAEARTVEAVLSAGSAVRRCYFTEELEISAEAVDLTRVEQGICPLLDTHNQYEINAVIGRVASVRIESGQLIGTLHFSETDAGRDAEARVARGELKAISIGYRVTKWNITATDDNDHETWLAVAWELLEASLVPVPADPNAVVRSAPGTSAHGNNEEDDMNRNLPGGGVAHPNANRGAATPPAPTGTSATPTGTEPAPTGTEPQQQPARTVTVARIREQCARTAELGDTFALELIEENERAALTEGDLMSRVADRLITARARPNVDVRGGQSGTESDGYRQAIQDAVTLRANPGTSLDADAQVARAREEAAREFRGMTMMELARDYLNRTGIRTSDMSRLEIAGQALGLRYGALTTSDFSVALANVTSSRVRAAFAQAPQTFRSLVSTGTLPDFKPANIISLGDAPDLLLVPENGEFKRGAMTDSGMTYRLQTYGRIIPITRQAIVNDDQRLFGRIPTMFGRKAADLESDLVWGLLLSNPEVSDGKPLFHADHGNVGAAGAITVATVGEGRLAMSRQRSDDGAILTLRPAFLIVGPERETEAEQFLTAVAATQTDKVNPFVGKLTLIIEPRITGQQWFLSTSPDAFDTIELAHLLGQEELFTETRIGFDVDGVENKARLDVGAAVLDHRGFYRRG
jgi:HK97 family phage prohead protease